MRPLAGMRKTVRRKPWPAEAVLGKPRHELNDSALFARSVVSPLRYPGAKRQLFHALRTIISANVPPPQGDRQSRVGWLSPGYVGWPRMERARVGLREIHRRLDAMLVRPAVRRAPIARLRKPART